MKIKIEELRKKIENVLTSTHYTQEQAKDIADVLIYAELTGKNTQGLLKLSGTEPIQDIKPQYEPKVIKETKLSALIDGGANPGILVSKIATRLAIEKCSTSGFSIIGTNNTFSSTGVLGYYATKMTEKDFIGIVMASPPGSVPPFGGIEPLLGTNPIAFGFPTKEWPIIFDMATSAITWYGLVRAKALGQKIPSGLAIDSKGNLTTDPVEAMEGAILPFEKGYKGSGLSLVVEIMAGALVEAIFPGSEEKGWGTLFIAIDPNLLTTTEKFKENSSLLIKTLKNSKKAKGHDTIHIPGWQGFEKKEKSEKTGVLEIEEEVIKVLA